VQPNLDPNHHQTCSSPANPYTGRTKSPYGPVKAQREGGSATHKEPTRAPTAYSKSLSKSHHPTFDPLIANVHLPIRPTVVFFVGVPVNLYLLAHLTVCCMRSSARALNPLELVLQQKLTEVVQKPLVERTPHKPSP